SDNRFLVYNSIGGKQEDLFALNLSSNADNQKGTASTENRQPLQLTNDTFKDRSPRWAPDAQKIVFYSDRSGKYQLWLINKDGSGMEQLTFGNENAFCPVWSPDSST